MYVHVYMRESYSRLLKKFKKYEPVQPDVILSVVCLNSVYKIDIGNALRTFTRSMLVTILVVVVVVLGCRRIGTLISES